ncbi:MAG: DUF1353 domain-containing protein [Arenicellales bacterium]
MKVEIVNGDKWYHRSRYRLLEDVIIAGKTVPSGFIADGASVPGFQLIILLWLPFWFIDIPGHYLILLAGIFIVSYFPAIGRYAKATFLHDFILSINPDRAEADRDFRHGLKDLGVIRWQRKAMYYAVRSYSLILEAWSWNRMK